MQRGSLRRRLRPSKAGREIVEKKWRRVKVSGQNKSKSLSRKIFPVSTACRHQRASDGASVFLCEVQVALYCKCKLSSTVKKLAPEPWVEQQTTLEEMWDLRRG